MPHRRRSCFYRAVALGKAPDGSLTLEFVEAERAFDPAKVMAGTRVKTPPHVRFRPQNTCPGFRLAQACKAEAVRR